MNMHNEYPKPVYETNFILLINKHFFSFLFSDSKVLITITVRLALHIYCIDL